MKTIIAFVALLAVAAAGVLPSNEVVVVNKAFHDEGLGTYSYSYELSDGTKREESAELLAARSAGEEATLRVRGAFEYLGDGKEPIKVTYTADENGFHPEGAHLP